VTTPLVTIVIPTYRRGALLARTLRAVAALDPIVARETVVVDDGSDEANLALVESAVAATPSARLIRQENAGPARARNTGYRTGAGDLVAFIDDDCAPTPDWLRRLVAPFAEGGERLGAVGGRVLPEPPHNWVSRFCAATEYSSGLQPVFVNAATANACFRRSVLDELGGFDEGFRHPGGDDPDLSERASAAGYRLEFVPDAIVYHSELESLGDFLGHMFRRGLGEARLAAKQGRRGRTALRAALLPVFLARAAAGCWRRTAGKGGVATRAAWTALDALGRAVFVVGSIGGLARSR
jgi:GT2 family glycosyltransferase